ncbi:MAG TPA: hypothetical protein VH560_07775, partial [Polyangia bacterium]|nr:hypothetical protein [Polyangia bacterium]
SDDPRYDDRDPQRWRLIYEGFGALLNVTALTASFEAAFVLKPQHDLRHAFLLRAYHTEAATIGVGASHDWFFGTQADKNKLTSAFSTGFTASRLDPSFGVSAGEKELPGYGVHGIVGLDHDTRDYLIDPWHAVGLSAAATYGLILLDDGRRFSQVGVGVEATRLFELLPGHVLGVDVSSDAQFGSFAVRAQLTDAGGLAALRGYLPSELLARANVIGRVQLRDDFVSGLDWNLLHFTTVRGFAGTLFADAAATTTCDGYAFSGDRVFSDVGYSFRALHDAFGVYQQLLSIDLAFPLTDRAAGGTCLGSRLPALPDNQTRLFGRPFTLLISFLPNF